MERNSSGRFIVNAATVAIMAIAGVGLMAESAIAAPNDDNGNNNRGKEVRIQRGDNKSVSRSNIPHNPPVVNRSAERSFNQPARANNYQPSRPDHYQFSQNRGGDNRGFSGGQRNNGDRGGYNNGGNNRQPQMNNGRNHNDGGRRNFEFSQRSGKPYYGPGGGRWTQWNKSWGDPRDYARRWGFDGYDAHRGWRRDGRWYAYPWLWSNWGGWYSFFLSGGNLGFSYSNGYQPYAGYGDSCMRVQTRDWYQGGRAVVSFMTCDNGWGQWTEVPGTRQFEYWTY